MSMGKREREPPAGDVGDDDGLADGRESSLLSSVESAAARARLRRLRRSAMCQLYAATMGRPGLPPGIDARHRCSQAVEEDRRIERPTVRLPSQAVQPETRSEDGDDESRA